VALGRGCGARVHCAIARVGRCGRAVGGSLPSAFLFSISSIFIYIFRAFLRETQTDACLFIHAYAHEMRTTAGSPIVEDGLCNHLAITMHAAQSK